MPIFPRRSRPARTSAALLLSTCLTVGLAACGGPAGGREQAAPGFPRTIDNCGRTTEVHEPPQRVVSLNQASTEILLSLGLEDRIVGTSMWTDPVLPELKQAADGIPRLADNMPSFESVLDAEPDFVSGSFAATLGKGGVATRDQFEELGVPTYLSPTDCAAKDNSGSGDGSRSKPLTMDVLYGEIRDLARIFDVEQRGQQLIDGLQRRLDGLDVDASGTSVLYWFANSDSPYLAGCCGAPGIMTRAVGADNAFDDTHAEWPQSGWENVAERDPDVIVLGDLTRREQTAESAESKIDFLESHPVTQDMTAVKRKRYVRLPGQALNPTIRTVDGAAKLATKLREFGLAR
ncbi:MULTISPECIES: ABC transporter substrate-binding protein [Prauserella salsuginis group]|uniref:Iron complex transport system substrate-binding protein n=2 Tax=Prauserella salsuginis group TaxID=2893672 RepID=A0A839XNM6_9PSEU|nr:MULTISPECIES: ABC transporter substrate-binding protein [Prauserella salsuginis group]MBB3663084.1 iron complex transport system substrate-binding protein [Prauserella sediminis]MCR3721082.1 iron complex transport system substrate-binding protein [Prauserella flava]MCR3734837.1 iron complex transport system substrate-binding protein [Prauserella salsuginis]